MSLPYQLRENKTWASGSTTGIQQQVQLTGPPLPSSGPIPLGSFPSKPAENWKYTNAPITVPIRVGRFSDESQLLYDQCCPLFVKDIAAPNYVGEQPVYALQNLNSCLEISLRNFETKKLDLDITKMITKPNGKMQDTLNNSNNNSGFSDLRENYDSFPLTPAAFARSISYLGQMHSSTFHTKNPSRNSVRSRELSATVANRVSFANIWGDGVKVGDQVGFMVKYIDNPYEGFVDINGQVSGTRIDKILQVRAHYEPESEIPCQSTEFGNPNPMDLDSINPYSIYLMRNVGYITKDISGVKRKREQGDNAQEQEEGGKKQQVEEKKSDLEISTGTFRYINWNKAHAGEGRFYKSEIIIETYECGFYIPIGKVMMVSKGNTDPRLIDMAHRSFTDYELLRSRCPIEIMLETQPPNQLSYLN